MQTALVLLADHELAASTLAARVAASVRADPYAVVATGLGAVGGALHGGAALGAEVMLSAADGPADAPRVVGDLLRRGERIPGFGHFVYKSGDPRGDPAAAGHRRARARLAPPGGGQGAWLDEVRRRALPEPNIDFALATLAGVAGMMPGAGEAIFAVARTAGWIAHALEEYDRNAPIRPRGIYTGPARSARSPDRAPRRESDGRRAPLSMSVEPRDLETDMPVRRLNHAVLYVADLAATVDFYRETLGFEVRMEIPGRAAFLRAPGSANDHDLGLFAGDRRQRPEGAATWACTTWPGRSARWPSWSRCASGWPRAAPWSAPATTGCPSRCTPRTRAASSSR